MQLCSCYKTEQERLDELWQSCADAMYSITEREKQLGMKNMVCDGPSIGLARPSSTGYNRPSSCVGNYNILFSQLYYRGCRVY